METAKSSAGKIYLFRFGGETILVPGSEIIYIHTEQRKLYLHTVRGVYRIGGSLKAAVKKVEDLPMVKTHASYLVHLDYICRINRHCAVLRNGENIPVSVRCWPLIRPVIEAYISRRGCKNPLTGE